MNNIKYVWENEVRDNEVDLQGIVKARNLSDEVMKNIKQNLFFALIYNTLGVPIAAGVLFPVFGILLSPMIAAISSHVFCNTFSSFESSYPRCLAFSSNER